MGQNACIEKGLKRARRIAHPQASIYATYVTAHVEYLESGQGLCAELRGMQSRWRIEGGRPWSLLECLVR